MSLRHAHLVVVTTYRRKLFTDPMPTCAEHPLRAVCAELDVELVEFNGGADHVHVLVAHPPTLAISALAHRLKGRTTYAVHREYTGACVRPPPQPPVVPVVFRRLLRRRTPIDHHAIHRRPSPTPLSAGLLPAKHEMGSPCHKWRGLRPRIRVTEEVGSRGAPPVPGRRRQPGDHTAPAAGTSAVGIC
nr:IS200/IS605 family transposase [Mycobacterium sp. SM1]